MKNAFIPHMGQKHFTSAIPPKLAFSKRPLAYAYHHTHPCALTGGDPSGTTERFWSRAVQPALGRPFAGRLGLRSHRPKLAMPWRTTGYSSSSSVYCDEVVMGIINAPGENVNPQFFLFSDPGRKAWSRTGSRRRKSGRSPGTFGRWAARLRTGWKTTPRRGPPG